MCSILDHRGGRGSAGARRNEDSRASQGAPAHLGGQPRQITPPYGSTDKAVSVHAPQAARGPAQGRGRRPNYFFLLACTCPRGLRLRHQAHGNGEEQPQCTVRSKPLPNGARGQGPGMLVALSRCSSWAVPWQAVDFRAERLAAVVSTWDFKWCALACRLPWEDLSASADRPKLACCASAWCALAGPLKLVEKVAQAAAGIACRKLRERGLGRLAFLNETSPSDTKLSADAPRRRGQHTGHVPSPLSAAHLQCLTPSVIACHGAVARLILNSPGACSDLAHAVALAHERKPSLEGHHSRARQKA